MLKKVTVNIVLCLVLLLAGFTKVPSQVSAATDEVSLLSTYARQVDAGGGFCFYGVGTNIKIKNIAYEKNVYIHFRMLGSNEWVDVKCRYSHSLNNGYEVWYGDPMWYSPYYTGIQFAIRYEVNGQTYWDNNNGTDYYVTSDDLYPEHTKYWN